MCIYGDNLWSFPYLPYHSTSEWSYFVAQPRAHERVFLHCPTARRPQNRSGHPAVIGWPPADRTRQSSMFASKASPFLGVYHQFKKKKTYHFKGHGLSWIWPQTRNRQKHALFPIAVPLLFGVIAVTNRLMQALTRRGPKDNICGGANTLGMEEERCAKTRSPLRLRTDTTKECVRHSVDPAFFWHIFKVPCSSRPTLLGYPGGWKSGSITEPEICSNNLGCFNQFLWDRYPNSRKMVLSTLIRVVSSAKSC